MQKKIIYIQAHLIFHFSGCSCPSFIAKGRSVVLGSCHVRGQISCKQTKVTPIFNLLTAPILAPFTRSKGSRPSLCSVYFFSFCLNHLKKKETATSIPFCRGDRGSSCCAQSARSETRTNPPPLSFPSTRKSLRAAVYSPLPAFISCSFSV